MAGVQIPVSLYVENLQKIINDLKSSLGNLKVGSSGFKQMENHIRVLQKELDKFQIQASKPFVSENQFVNAEKSVDKLEEEIERVSLTASRLKFSDLELNGEQKAQLKAVEDEINSIRASFKALKDEAKQSFLKTAEGDLWSKMHPEDKSRSLEQMTNNIRKEVKEQNEILEKAEEQVAKYKRAIAMGDAVKAMNKARGKDKDPEALKALMGTEFSTFFKEIKGGKIQFQTGQQSLFAAWLEKNFAVDESVVRGILKKSAPEIAAALNDTGSDLRKQLQNAKVRGDSARIKLPGAETDAASEKAKLQELTGILNAATGATDSMKVSEEQLQQALTAAGVKLENTKDAITADIRAKEEWRNVNQRGTAELEQLRTTLQQTNAQFLQQQRITSNFNSMKMAVVNFMGFRQVLNITKNAIREAINHIKELDTVMNKISIVTDMDTSDLWAQVDQYSEMAQQYGTTIKGAYEVSQIYYQQGLETNDVLTLTNETLKLAKVSGLDYATTTDYMTTALRGFKMEMSEASTVVDVYSNLAAHTAVSQEELAVAMSKTASSMESVGSTFEESSAMIATMVAVTRESATNIGSALKSIASRYGEMKSDPLKLIDSEGDIMSFNKVDAALQSVGISMKTADGQFRSFTEVILELSEKWDQLESTQQRYIATQFAGNRQQSRFLALVSNPELLQSNLGYAEESEDTGTLQALKALDSIESKLNQVQVAYQQFYTTMGIENVWKGLLDGAKEVINTLNGLPKLFGKLPLGAVAIIYDIISLIKSAAISGLTSIATIVSDVIKDVKTQTDQAANDSETNGHSWSEKFAEGIRSGIGGIKNAAKEAVEAAKQEADETKVKAQAQLTVLQPLTTSATRAAAYASAIAMDPNATHAMETAAAEKLQNLADQARAFGLTVPPLSGDLNDMGQTLLNILNPALEETKQKFENAGREGMTFRDKVNAGKQGLLDFAKNSKTLVSQLGGIASAFNMLGSLFNTTTREGQAAAGSFMIVSGALRGMQAAAEFAKSGLSAGFWGMAAMAVVSIVNGISTAYEDAQERQERLMKEAEELGNKAKEAKANYRTLDNSVKKLDELREKRYESAESAEEYQEAVDELAGKFPELISGFDEAGNIIIKTTDIENVLAKAREKSAEATLEAVKAEFKAAKDRTDQALKNKNLDKDVLLDTLGFNSNDKTFSGGIIADIQASRGRQRINKLRELAKNQGQDTESQLETLLLGQYSTDQYTYDNIKSLAESIGLNITDEDFSGLTTEQDLIDSLQATIQEISTYDSFDSKEAQDGLLKLHELIMQGESLGLNLQAYLLQLGDLNTSIQKYNDLNNLLQSYSSQVASGWLAKTDRNKNYANSKYATSMVASVLTSNEAQNELGRKYANSEEYRFDLTQDVNLEALDTANEQLTVIADTFFKNLNDEQLKLFDKMTGDTANYSSDDFDATFGKINGFEEFKNKILIPYYKDGIELIHKRLESNFKKVNQLDDDTNLEELSYSEGSFEKRYLEAIKNANKTTEELYLNSVLEQTENLKASGYNKRATSYGDSALTLFDQIRQLPNNLDVQMWSLIQEHGLNTIEGINNIIDGISHNDNLSKEQKDSLTPLFTQIKDNIIPNISLAIQTATSNLLETWEDTSKELSSAMSGGVSLKEADALINKAKSLGLDFDLSNFELQGDKLVLVGQSFDDYYKALTEANEKASNEWQKRIDNATRILHDAGTDNWNYTEDDRALFESLGFDITDTKNYYNGHLTDEGWEALQKAIAQNQKDVDNYNRAAQIAADQLLIAHERSQGTYRINTDGVILLFDQLKEIAASTTLTNTGEDISRRAIKDSLNSAYDTLISDVLAKGLDRINLDDYEGLIASDKDVLKTYLNTNRYQDFIKRYAQLAGKSIDETNELIAQAIEKERETISSEVLSNLQFINQNQFTASLSDLTELANRFNIDLSKLTTRWSSDLGAYVVNITDIDGLDLSQIENSRVIINDSINAFFDDLVGLIKSALDGSLSNVDRTKLQNWVANYNQQFGENLQLDFTRTVEGLQLSEQSAIGLYSALKQVDSLQASLVFDELNKSLKESGGYYKSISSTEARIFDLEQKINNNRKEQIAQAGYQVQAGNVDLVAHASHQISGSQMQAAGWKDFNIDDYATLYSSTYDGKKWDTNVVLNITPITNDGTTIKSREDLDAYVEKLMEGGGTAKDIMARDTEHLVMGAWDVDVKDAEKLKAGVAAAEDNAEKLHVESDAIAKSIEKWDDPNDARIKQYKEELALAQEIKAVRSTTEDDSFNFMSNKIPAAQNNPLNYFSNWAQAWKTLTESSKSGTMDYTAFYNIVTEMGKLAEKSGAITVGAGTVLRNSEDAAALIDAAAQSLRVDANGELTVDLSNLANLGFNFEAAGADMSKGIDAGIKEIAQSQIKMLDGMIQLMETIVAMEELGKIDLDNNNTLDLNEIFKVKYDANGFQLNEKYWDQFTDNFKEIAAKILKDSESNKDLTAALKDVVINGYSLHDIFQDAIDGTKDLPIDAEAYTAIMNAFYRAAISGDYDLDNIMASIQSVLASNGYEGNIDVGDMHITIHQGVTLQRDENGNYIVDGQSYTDINTATKVQQASAIGEFTNAIKETDPETGNVTYTAGELSATVQYDIESKKYHVKFSDGTSADADDVAGARFAIQAWAQMNDTDLSEVASENAEGQKLSFTYNAEAGVTMNIEADVTTGEITYTHSGAPDQKAGKVVQDLQEKIGKVTVPVTTTPESTPSAQTVTVTTEGVDTAQAALDKLLKTLEDIESKSNITININSDGTTTNNNSPLVKEVQAKIIEYTNGEGEKANPAQLVSDLHAIITNYADPESNKAELLRALTAYITSYDDSKATKPTLDELTEFITKINTEGADAALEAWRKKQEEKKVNIQIESETKENVDAKYNDIRKAVSHVDYNPSSGEAVRKNELAKIDKLGLDQVNWTPAEYALGGINEAAEGAPNLKQYVTYLQDLVTSGQALGNVDISNLEELQKIPLIAEDAKQIQDILDTNMLLTQNQSPDMFNSALEALTNVIAIAQQAGEEAGNAKDKAEELKTSLDTSISVEVETETATSKITSLQNAWDNWTPKNKSLPVNAGGYGTGRAGGNIGQANAKGTLMGELGPELVVSNGRYFVAGQNGPEMIDLADDAIVFNHLQTKSLLEKGMSSGRGKAVTNERNAIAFATGSVHGGPAMASASAALQALKQLRSQWQSLLGLSMQDLAGAGGSGGGGGDNKAFIKELERWYNWLQKIAQLEKQINYYEADRNRISSEWRADGYKYFNDQKKTIDALSQQLEIQKDLTLSQEEYFEKRRAELNSDKNPFSSLYSFNEQGQILYKSGKFEELSNMVGTNKYNNPNMSAQEQYEYIIKNLGIDEKYFEYDASGNKIEADDYTAKIQKFWDQIESDKEEMQSGYDAVQEGYIKLQELQKQQNDLLKEMRDNQMDLEQKIYDAIVDTRQRAIDELSDTKDAIQKSNEKFIEGLSKALEKERNMYDNKQAADDLDKLRRQRDILIRSGGSASEISSLEEQISEQEQSIYFDKQQEQIDAIQEASDKQIEKLETEISLQTEILEYQKKHGLLWAEVTDIMGRSPEEIARFIAENDSSYWDKSPIASADALNQLLFQSEQWDAYKNQGGEILAKVGEIAGKLAEVYGEKEKKDKDKEPEKQPEGSPEGQPEGQPEGEGQGEGGQDGKKKKYKATVTYYKGSGATGTSVGIGIADTIEGAKAEAYKRAINNIPANAVDLGGVQYEEMQYKNGGYNYNTGLAMLHGTSSKPEAVLNAEQTKVLRDNILSNKPDSLISLLKTYNDITHGVSSSTYNSVANQSSSLVIEKAEVNLKVDKLANDYDSRQAATTIMDEMLRIASKSGANNGVRR